ncbi:MAG: type VI secretion system baseplate subunit TssE [Planctomycetales bacterium]|nr:type VI secretion system baseplate subunit TssE [Planctomycetales bacterium]
MAETPIITQSILDRLSNSSSREGGSVDAYKAIEQMRASVQRNLEDLMNTRVRCTSWPASLSELENSLLNYGIPDLTAAHLQSEQSRKEFLRELERRIKFFEPRLKGVRVIPVENSDFYDRTLRFRIDATLLSYPMPEPIAFDSTFDPTVGQINVRGGME